MPTSTIKSGSESNSAVSLFRKARFVFWDFDGVIKDTVNLKGEVFARLFCAHGDALADKIRNHHSRQGGVSRLEKIPIYLGWAGLPQDTATVHQYCERFARLVFQGVLTARWIPGVESLLRRNPFGQKFFLVTATPQEEIETILAALDLAHIFEGVFGAPLTKTEVIQWVVAVSGITKELCLLIGDSQSDHAAAAAANIAFLLRTNPDNNILPWQLLLPRISDFLNI